MEVTTEGGETIYLIDGLDPVTREVSKFGITQRVTKSLADRGNTVRLAHLFFIVDPGLILAQFAFRGLRRPLQYGEDLNGDTDKFVYSWKQKFDFDWPHARRFDGEIGVTKRDAPPDRVFVVVATPNKYIETYPSVKFWIEGNWTWVRESSTCPCAPTNWEKRYEERIELR